MSGRNNRYDYDYKKQRKGFYPKRSLSSSGPEIPNGSSSANGSITPLSSNSINSNVSANSNVNNSPITNNGRPRYSSYGSYGSKYNNYYPSYGSYNTFKRESKSVDYRYDNYKGYNRNRSSLSNSVKRRNSSLLNTKRADTYYPKANHFKQVDHYSTKKEVPNRQKTESPLGTKDDDNESKDDESKFDDEADESKDYDEHDEIKDFGGKDFKSKESDEEEDDEMKVDESMDDMDRSQFETDKSLQVSEAESDEEPPPGMDDENEAETSTLTEFTTSTDFSTTDKVRPLIKLESLYEDLEVEFQSHNTKYPAIENFQQLPFYKRNLILYQHRKPQLTKLLTENHEKVSKLKVQLWNEYKNYLKVYEIKYSNMEEQLKFLHPPNDEQRRELESVDIRIKHSEPESSIATPDTSNLTNPSSGRRSRSGRHGDLVTTEAEFEEVLKSLTQQDDEDPMLKALRVSAPVPELKLDELEKNDFYDFNNVVHDKLKWCERLHGQFKTNFNEKERELFCEAYVKYPKKFGYISKYMGGLRTARECVIHYYVTKKVANYKALVNQYKKKASKSKKKKKQSEVTNEEIESEPIKTEIVQVPVDTPVSIPVAFPTTVENEEFTDTGRRKRAAAPQFEDSKRKKPKEEELIINEDDKPKTISSYWSITESNQFPQLLSEYGSNWTIIAEKLTSKTSTMVKNYFQRNCEKYRWLEIVKKVDEKNGVVTESDGPILGTFDRPQYQQVYPYPANIQPAIQPNVQSGVQPLPTFQPNIQSIVHPTLEPIHVPQIKTEVHKSSIMNLLNDSPIKSPVKEIQPELPDNQPKSEHPPKPIEHHTMPKLNDILS